MCSSLLANVFHPLLFQEMEKYRAQQAGMSSKKNAVPESSGSEESESESD